MIKRNSTNIFTDTQAVIKTKNNLIQGITYLKLDNVAIATKFYTTTRIRQVN